jgi:galactonate dehydratase
MLIKDIKTYHPSDGARNSIFLHVFTDEGITGVGQPYTIGPDEGVIGLIESIKPWFVGQDPSRIEWLMRRARNNMRFPLGQVAWSALSGIEMALWDIQGKALELPVYMLLGGKVRDKIRLYHGIHGDTPDMLAENARALVAEGYTGLKMFPCPGYADSPWNKVVRDSAARMEAVRKAVGGSIDIAVDIHTTVVEASKARELIEAMEPYRLFFVEEPVRPDNIATMARLREQVRVPIATGENLYGVTMFNELLDAEAVDIIQPDLCVCGGLSEAKKICAAAEAHYVTVSPHNPLGLLSTAAAVHLAASTPNFIVLEYHGDHTRPKAVFVDDPWTPENGYFALPTRPGLGMELNVEAIESHPTKPWSRGFPTHPDGAPAFI